MNLRIASAVIAAAGLLAATGAGAALADTQPTGGYASTGRNDKGFGGGPHCHIQVIATERSAGDRMIAVFPSHTAHAQTGLPSRVFVADPNCDGDPGQ